MALRLMYITNRPEIAHIAEQAGVDRIWVDLEYIGKSDRQGGMDTVQNRHTAEDVANIAGTVTASQVLVRVNPIHEALPDYFSSEDEINTVISNGADVVMLPFFKTPQEVERFIRDVDGRVKTQLLLETPEAVDCLDDILSVGGIDEVHIGLNDLSLGYHRKFMFELLADGTVERLMEKLHRAGVVCGFGGVGRPGSGTLPADYILGEHVRLGSETVILSRSFCNTTLVTDLSEITRTFREGVADIRRVERECQAWTDEQFGQNHQCVVDCVRKIVQGM